MTYGDAAVSEALRKDEVLQSFFARAQAVLKKFGHAAQAPAPGGGGAAAGRLPTRWKVRRFWLHHLLHNAVVLLAGGFCGRAAAVLTGRQKSLQGMYARCVCVPLVQRDIGQPRLKRTLLVLIKANVEFELLIAAGGLCLHLGKGVTPLDEALSTAAAGVHVPAGNVGGRSLLVPAPGRPRRRRSIRRCCARARACTRACWTASTWRAPWRRCSSWCGTATSTWTSAKAASPPARRVHAP